MRFIKTKDQQWSEKKRKPQHEAPLAQKISLNLLHALVYDDGQTNLTCKLSECRVRCRKHFIVERTTPELFVRSTGSRRFMIVNVSSC